MSHVELRHVSKSFTHDGSRVAVLDDVNLTVEPGEFACLLGPSGCGKSTIVQLIAGLEKPDAGQVFVGAVPVAGPDPSRMVVFQDGALFPWLSVLGNVEFGLRMAGLAQPARRDRAMAYIKLVHLSRFVRAFPHQLSGGMRQRVAIARALAMEPQILLMDEPFGALDAQTRAILQEELLEIWQKTRTTLFFVTHNVREATGLADRVFEISSRPRRIKRVYRIDVGRPRLATDPVLVAIQRRILDSLGEEIAKVTQEELGEAVRFPEAAGPSDPDRSLGMHI